MTVDFSEYFWVRKCRREIADDVLVGQSRRLTGMAYIGGISFLVQFQGEGQKNNGLDVLFQNMKYGITTTKELSDFIRERSSLEESHSKALTKLAKLAGNGCANGSFAPLWQILRNSSEELSKVHGLMVQKVEDLFKDLVKYTDDLQKKYKSVKDEESATIEAVQLYHNSKAMVAKAKALYVQRYLELEKCQKENASSKDVEKAEIKMKKAQLDYKAWVEKCQSYRDDYLTKMTEACRRFQDVEEIYLIQMKEFLDSYATVMENNHELIGQVHLKFRQECASTTVEDLLQQFLKEKATGNDKPGVLEIEEVGPGDGVSRGSGSSEDKSSLDKSVGGEKKREGNIDNSVEDIRSSKGSRRTTSLLNLFIPLSQGNKGNSSSKGTESPSLELCTGLGQMQPNATNNKPTLSRSANRGSKWFLSRRGKKKDKKSKKKDGLNQDGKDEKSDGEDKDESHKSDTPTAEVDAEGYTVRPPTNWEENDKRSFYSSSGSDSDEEPGKQLHVVIKPLTNGTAPLSASVDELRSTVENMTLSPVGLTGRKILLDADSQMKRSQSVSQQIGSSSPPSRHPYTPLSPPIPPPNPRSSPKLNQNDATSRYADLGDIFAEVGDIQPALPPKTSVRNTPTPSGMSIPRPPSRPRPETITQRNTGSPSPAVSRTESISSLDTRSLGSHLVGSRGPSPLTIGMADSIPLAVAFHEIVHAYFKGNDENQCQVKMTGDMMVSFPAGIIQVFASNPMPAQLTCKVRSKQPLDNLVSNKDLVKVERFDDELHFEFNMSALIVLLKNNSEQNPHASYFNVDILKYQIKPKYGASSCPLHLVAFWKCEVTQTDLRIDYKYNSHAMEMAQSEVVGVNHKTESASGAQLVQVCIAAPVDGGVKTMQSKPTGQWFPNTNRACWKLPSLSSKSENLGVGSLRARFEISSGPSSHGTIAAQFSCENSTLSGCDFELIGSGYRVSLVKKRFVSGKYICDAEDSSSRYAVPPDRNMPI